jgi:hypothetical protein
MDVSGQLHSTASYGGQEKNPFGKSNPDLCFKEYVSAIFCVIYVLFSGNNSALLSHLLGRTEGSNPAEVDGF